MWIQREIESTLKDLAQKRPALVLTGCRQAGKTSLLRHVFPKAQYISLDLPLEAAQAEENSMAFLAKHKTPLILDEVQYAPGILPYLKNSIDRKRNLKGRYLITGSQKFPLMAQVTESLAGRSAVLDCLSLSALEGERAWKKPFEGEMLWKWIWQGGYPELHKEDLKPQRYYADYLVTYLERDVRQLIQVRSLRDFERFLRLAATRTGQLLSLNGMAGDIGVSVNTLKSWLSVLESSNIVYLLEPYYQNLGKRLVKTPKLYFLDTGLAAFLAGFDSQSSLQKSTLAGAFFETHALGQILRYFSNRGERPGLYFYRDHEGNEVDFVIPQGEALHLLECKLTASPKNHKRRPKGFEILHKKLGEKNILTQVILSPLRENISFSNRFYLNSTVELDSVLAQGKHIPH